MRCAQQGGELASVQGAEHARGPIDVRGHDRIQQAMKLCIRQLDVVQRLEVPAEVLLQSGAVADVGAVGVLEVLQLLGQALFNILFDHGRQANRAEDADRRGIGIRVAVSGGSANPVRTSCMYRVLQRETASTKILIPQFYQASGGRGTRQEKTLRSP